MKPKVVFSILLNILALAIPGAILFNAYGPTAQVDPQSTKDLMYLLGSALFSFALGLGSGALLRGADKPAIVSFVETILRGHREAKSEA